MKSEKLFRDGPASAGFRARSVKDMPNDMAMQVAGAVDRAKEGDREALGFLYGVYADSIYGYVRSIVHDHHEAEDLTQHVFAKLISAILKYDDLGVPFFAWLLRLARNVTIDHVRSRRAIPTEQVFELDHVAPFDLERPQAIRAALGSLPPDQRRVVLLRHVVGLSPGEIANEMGRSESSVHGLHHRGRLALQDELVRLESAPLTRNGQTLEMDRAA